MRVLVCSTVFVSRPNPLKLAELAAFDSQACAAKQPTIPGYSLIGTDCLKYFVRITTYFLVIALFPERP